MQRRPFLIDRRIPGRIAIATFVDGGLPKDALERKAVRERGPARLFVERVALPLGAAVAEAEHVRE